MVSDLYAAMYRRIYLQEKTESEKSPTWRDDYARVLQQQTDRGAQDVLNVDGQISSLRPSTGDYRAKRERGFASEDDAIAWWMLQKQNRHRPVAKAEAGQSRPDTLDTFLDRWLKTSATTMSTAALATCEKHARLWIRPSLGHVLLPDLERSPELIEQTQASC